MCVCVCMFVCVRETETERRTLCYITASRLVYANQIVPTTALLTINCFTNHFEVKAKAPDCRDSRTQKTKVLHL